MANNPKAVDNLKPFKPKDPRINRKGRPKNFDMARELAQQIGHEVITGEGGQQLKTPKGDLMTRIEAILRTWSSSRNFKAQETFMHYAVGKPKDELDITSGGKPLTWAQFIANATGTSTDTDGDAGSGDK